MNEAHMQDAEPTTPTRRVPLMTEVAIVSTLLLIAAPIVLVGATLAAAARKRLSKRNEPASTVAER